MKQQKKSLPDGEPGYTKNQLIEEVRKHGFDFDARQLSDFVRLGLICKSLRNGKAGGGSEEGVWPAGQLPLLLTMLKLRDAADHQAGHHLYRRTKLCAVPVSGWLYWGEEHTSVPLKQVKHALTTWAKDYQRSNAGQAEQQINTLLQFITSPQAMKGGRKYLKEELQYLKKDLLETNIRTGMPLSEQKVDEVLDYLRYVIDPDNTGEGKDTQLASLTERDEIRNYLCYIASPSKRETMKNTQFAPLFAESILHLTNFRLIAIQRLLPTPDIPDTLWEWARACLLYSKKLYRESQSHLIIDTALKPMFVDNEPMSACEDLLTMLGIALSRFPCPGLPPFLQQQR